MSHQQSSLMPVHSNDMAAELSAHLSSALASDLSYSQVNDAKMRGLSSLVGWDQFHGMVLTAHLAPVNLREEPIDELAKGLARNKKVEQEKTRNINQFALKQLEQNQTSEEERKKNEEFLKEVDLQAPKNAHEFSRDWKRIGANAMDKPEFISAQRYRYLLSIDLSTAALLLKGGIPLEMIGSIIGVVHSRWLPGESTAAATPPNAESDSTANPDPATSLIPSYELQHVATLLHALTGMASFTISIFSLSKVDKARVRELIDIIEERAKQTEFIQWREERTQRQSDSNADAVASAASVTPADSLTAPAATSAPSASKPASSSSSSYPMLLPGWPVGVGETTSPSAGGSGGSVSSNFRSSGPARDESNSASTMIVTAAATAHATTHNRTTNATTRNDTHIDINEQNMQQLRIKYKCA